MRISLPVHIPLSRVVIFAILLFLLEVYQGTSLLFALAALVFIVVAGITFNLAGGLSRPSGGYVFFYALLAVIAGLVTKAALGEPADSNLELPLLTMEVYAGTMISMLIAVLVARKLTVKRPLLGKLVPDAEMGHAAYGCLVTGLALVVLGMFEPAQAGGLLSALQQVNRFLPMAMILGIVYEMRRTGGRRSVNPAVALSGLAIFGQGLLGFSKEGIFTPVACWFIAVASQGYRFSKAQIVGWLCGVFIMVHYLVPYSQYGRNLVGDEIGERIHVALTLLSDLDDTRAKYKENAEDSTRKGYFNKDQGFFDRLQMILPDDSLHALTARVGPIGPAPVIFSFENLVPRFLWPDKPTIKWGNLYARQMGLISPDDTTTGISFSPAGEAFHIDRWFGVFFWAPLIWTMLFVVFDSLCGDARRAPWGLLALAIFAHAAPEGGITGPVYFMSYIAAGIVFAALAAAYVMPLLGTLIAGPARPNVIPGTRFRGPTRPVRSLPSSTTGQ
ncbi:MAG TPA: hypothetical protein VHN81_10315 [Edaphobacter sp.]|nr:hypothetical protein [Edaphobacter sp.]